MTSGGEGVDVGSRVHLKGYGILNGVQTAQLTVGACARLQLQITEDKSG